ncbi:uncharacterized protein HMPREF1541_10455 [Cyphellophora europaea CBS 101466]|uniref:Uncharacterized protein n=1 Tax=Cyphellophora europaea (strain CBS 101466) TaxID=1220924 RepID=W2S6L8_CYPE1|nr:uncharacterized protein HMPREF1541_10455 [Cyphellophora europaea CBS 101466]ETN44275.1 hypothetical protein HMPREF1541_10455 [Cyphellophora europaea CBS 101466]
MSPPQQPRPPRRRTRAQAFAAGSSRPSVADASTEMRTSPPRSQTPLYTPPTGTGLEDTKPPLWSIQYSVLETEEPTTPGNTSKRRRKDRKRAMGQKYPEHPHDDDDLGLPIFQDSYMTRILPQIAALGVKPDTQLQTPFERAPNHPGPSPTVSASDYSLETGRVQAHIVPRKYAMTQARFRVVSKAGTRVFLQPQLGFGISSTYKRVSQDGVAISAKDVQYDNDVQGIVFADWIEPKREGMLKEQDRLTKLWANKVRSYRKAMRR